jgi:hypothetical protein
MSDYGLSNVVTADSILDQGWVKSNGDFDLITCIDVIEHVNDVHTTFRHISNLLSNNGCAYLEVPNKDALTAVLSDGHFSLFGITQLPRWAAIAYHRHNFSFGYDVGDYYDLAFYIDIARQNGFSVEVNISPLHSYITDDQACELLSKIQEIVSHPKSLHNVSTEDISSLLVASVRSYLDCYQRSKSGAADGGFDTVHRMRFLTPFWLLKLTKREIFTGVFDLP